MSSNGRFSFAERARAMPVRRSLVAAGRSAARFTASTARASTPIRSGQGADNVHVSQTVERGRAKALSFTAWGSPAAGRTGPAEAGTGPAGAGTGAAAAEGSLRRGLGQKEGRRTEARRRALLRLLLVLLGLLLVLLLGHLLALLKLLLLLRVACGKVCVRQGRSVPAGSDSRQNDAPCCCCIMGWPEDWAVGKSDRRARAAGVGCKRTVLLLLLGHVLHGLLAVHLLAIHGLHGLLHLERRASV